MSQIILEVDDKNVEIVMTIINNLKAGLITKVSSDVKKPVKPIPTNTNKYMSRDAYKSKLQNR
jgi:hypothetical protein